MPLNAAMVTTALELPGYKIVQNLGVVRGIVVRSRSIRPRPSARNGCRSPCDPHDVSNQRMGKLERRTKN